MGVDDSTDASGAVRGRKGERVVKRKQLKGGWFDGGWTWRWKGVEAVCIIQWPV